MAVSRLTGRNSAVTSANTPRLSEATAGQWAVAAAGEGAEGAEGAEDATGAVDRAAGVPSRHAEQELADTVAGIRVLRDGQLRHKIPAFPCRKIRNA